MEIVFFLCQENYIGNILFNDRIDLLPHPPWKSVSFTLSQTWITATGLLSLTVQKIIIEFTIVDHAC